MAALRFFARSALSTSRLSPVYCNKRKIPFPINDQIQTRWASVNTTNLQQSEELPEFEISRDPKEWKYVERCLKEKLVPKAPVGVYELPSGWKPQDPKTKELPYFVERSKNHMQSVYLRITRRGTRRVTLVKRIQGDIMKLGEELRGYVEEKTGKTIGTQINEPAGLIKFRGDVVTHCQKFLDDKGF